MRDTLKVLLRLRDEGTLVGFAIGGAIAASYSTPAVVTKDILAALVNKFGLMQRWEIYVKRYAQSSCNCGLHSCR